MISVLLVDDEPDLLEIAKLLLERDGSIAVTTCTRAPEALDLLRSGGFDAVVSDLEMPVMSGIDLHRTLKGEGISIPFIIFTGRGREHVVIEALNLGVDFYLQKGGDTMAQFTELRSMIQQAAKRKNAEEALRLREEQYRTLVEASPDAIVMTDRTGKIIFCNSKTVEFYGCSAASELTGTDVLSLLLPHEHMKALSDWHITMQEGVSRNIEYNARRSDGVLIPVEVSSAVMYDQNGVPEGTISVIKDIRYRKLADEELKKREQHLRVAIEGANLGVWFYDLERNWASHTGRWYEILGYSNEELNGMSNGLLGLVHPEDLTGVDESISLHLEGETPFFDSEHRIRNQDGSWVWVQSRGEVVKKDADGKPLHFAGVSRDITAQREAVEARRASETRFRDITDLLPVVVFEISTDGDLLFSNKFGFELFQCTEEEFRRSLNVLDRIVEEQRPIVIENIRLVLEGKQRGSSGTVYTFMRMDGTRFPGVIYSDRILDPGTGSPTGIRGVIVDVTEKERIADSLRKKKEVYRTVFENTGTPMAIIREDMTVLRMNAAAEEYFGYKREEIEGKIKWTEFFHERNRPRIISYFQGVLEEKEDYKSRTELRVHDRSGKEREAYITFSFMPDSVEVVASIIDVSELRKLEHALFESEERFHILLDTIPGVSVQGYTADGTVVYWNRASETVYGFSEEEAMGKNLADLIVPEELRELFFQCLEVGRQVTASGEFMPSGELLLLHKDGHRVPVYSMHCAVSGMEKEPILFCLDIDLSVKKEGEKALKEMIRKINLLNDVTRHDVLNKVSELQGYLGIARESCPDITDTASKMEEIAATIRRQIEFTREFQDIGVNNPGWRGLEKTVSEATAGFDLSAVEVSKNLGNLEIFADPLIDRVFSNLVDNTMRHGGEVKIIRFCSREKSGALSIYVEDDGVGIDVRQKNNIFNYGYGRNNGYGLFLAKEILGSTGITIRENGKPGKGARFELLVPPGMYRSLERD